MFGKCAGCADAGLVHMLKTHRISLFYGVVAALLLAGALYVPYDVAFPPLHELKDPAATSLQMIGEIAKLVMTLNTAMLAGAGALLTKRFDWIRLTGFDKLVTVSVFLCGAVSYFGVYFSQVRMLTMTSTGFIDPLEAGLLWGIRFQYGGLIAGVLLLGFVFARGVDADHSRANGDATSAGGEARR